jgi:hypothetical protein
MIHLPESTIETLDQIALMSGFARSVVVERLLRRAVRTRAVKELLKGGKFVPGALRRGPEYARQRVRQLRAEAKARGERISNEEIAKELNKRRCFTRYGKTWKEHSVGQQFGSGE